jgi:hypothetical protein
VAKEEEEENPLRTMDDFRGRNVTVLLEINVNSCCMLDCIRIAMLGINI